MRLSPILSVVSLLVLAGCEIERKSSDASPTDTAAATGTGTAAVAPADTARPLDTLGAPGAGTAGPAVSTVDSALLEIWPAQPRRGGVVWARLRDVGDGTPRCTWNGATLPCHGDDGDALVVVPLPADAPAGIFALGVEAGGRRVTRSVQVAERDFGRELVFLDSATWRLTQDAAAIARDARATRAVLAGQSAERRWGSEAWREPKGARSAGYGVERYYYRASDSTRAITLGGDVRTSGAFGADTTSGPRAPGSVPAWRHAGVDLPLARGTRVEAPAGATVADVGQYHLTGRTLVLDHGHGVLSAYFHLDSALVRRGDVVRAGQAVARVGSTGLSTGPHLHYGVYVHGRDVDPAAWRELPPWLRSNARRTASGTATEGTRR